MSVQRTGRLREEQLGQLLDSLETSLQDFKSGAVQQLQSSVVHFQSDTGAAYDWSGTLPQQSGAATGHGLACFSVEATAASMSNLYATLNNQLFINTPISWYRPIDYLTDVVNGVPGFQTLYNDVPNNTGSPATKVCIVFLLGDTTRTAYIKFYVEALDHATLSITRLI